jgi:hypothetical protein
MIDLDLPRAGVGMDGADAGGGRRIRGQQDAGWKCGGEQDDGSGGRPRANWIEHWMTPWGCSRS